MGKPDQIEFYKVETGGLVAVANSSHNFSNGDLVNIRGKTWQVKRKTFYVDHADSTFDTAVRCTIEIQEAGSE